MKKHSNTSTSFQLKKLQDRVAKSKEAVNRTRDAYKAELQDLNRYNPQVRLSPCGRNIPKYILLAK